MSEALPSAISRALGKDPLCRVSAKRHSANTRHSVKAALPSARHSAKSSTRQREALPSAWHSAKNRHSAKPGPGWRPFYLPSADRLALGKEFFLFFKKISLPSAPDMALGKEFFIFFPNFFAECPWSGTRQRIFLFFSNFFAECPWSGTRQRIFWKFWNFSRGFAECPCVRALGKELTLNFFFWFWPPNFLCILYTVHQILC